VTYRQPSDPDEGLDPEAVAIAAISRRAGRVRAAVVVPLLLAGIGSGAVLYVVLRQLQFEATGAHIPWLTGTVSFAPTFGGAFWLAPRLAGRILRPLLERWRAELATAHGLDLGAFTEITRLLD
jgi:hypothetical protein